MKEKNKYTLITGASSGIGYESAKLFASKGKNLIIVARTKNNLIELKTEILKENPSLDIIIKNTDLSVVKNVYELYNSLKNYNIETLINNAGFGNYDNVVTQNLNKIETMLDLNVKAVTILSSLFVHDYKDVEGTTLINISSAGGYTLVPNAVTYCASKFFVSAFTEGLAHELIISNAKLQAKVLAPAATKTNFGNVANNISNYDYDKSFGTYHTSREMAEFLFELYTSKSIVGLIDRDTFKFKLTPPMFPDSYNSTHNQNLW